MNTLISSEHISLLEDRTFRNTADRLVVRLGVRPDLTGFRLLSDAVILYGTGNYSFCTIYKMVAAYRSIKPKTVPRLISYALSEAIGLLENLRDLTGVLFREADIHAGLIIAHLGKIFKDPDLARKDIFSA